MQSPGPLNRPSTSHRCRLVAWTLLGLVGLPAPTATWGGGSASIPTRTGLQAMPATPNSSTILVDYYDALLRDGDLEAFRRNVAARYNEATLARLLDGGDTTARRASALALGLFGTFRASNTAIAGAFRDKDPTVRALASDAAWSIWYRGDSAANNARLDEIRRLLEKGNMAEAIRQANGLTADAPTFAEAYNQRAIAHFLQGDLEASVADCQVVLKHNPFHFGALSGQGQCLLQLNRTTEAIAVFRRALEVQPYDANLRGLITALEQGQ